MIHNIYLLAGPFFFLFALTKADGLLLFEPAAPAEAEGALEESLPTARRPPPALVEDPSTLDAGRFSGLQRPRP